MKNLFTFIAISAFAILPLTSFSQAQLKIGHVNFDEIMAALPERDSAQVVLEKESKELQSAYEEMSVDYNKLYDDYQKGLSTYSAVVRKAKEDELIDKQKRMAEFEQNASGILQNRNVELLKPIIEKINTAINKYATDNGFTYILDISKGSVVFTSRDSQNITQMVIKALKV
ncbi:MAG TPA: OmpH family outer membrane protein [Bacteroidales bacterium]|nr:OmpH family outer membrane protein [Bacteroidales bacterium]